MRVNVNFYTNEGMPVSLNPNIINAALRDEKEVSECQARRNNEICKDRMRSWLYNRGYSSARGELKKIEY